MSRYASLCAWRISGPSFVLRKTRARLAKILANYRRSIESPKLFCLPGDDIGDSIISNGWYEDAVLSAIFNGLLSDQSASFSNSIAIDVGANIGNHSLWLSKSFAHVVAFEPNPICAHVFEANMLVNAAENVRLFRLGLSDSPGTLPFHLNTTGNLGNSGFTPALAENSDRTLFVDVVTGDSVLDAAIIQGRDVRLVKLDVEGHELAALKGMIMTIRRFRPIIMFESHGANGPGGSDEIVDLLAGEGYRYFYVLERDRAFIRSRALKALRRLMFGEKVIAMQVDRPEDRHYSLIIGSVDQLAAMESATPRLMDGE